MSHIGRMREVVVFQRQAEISDAYGNTEGVWQDLFTDWGDMVEEGGREMVRSGAQEEVRRAELRVWQSVNTGGVRTGDRVVVRGEPWDILSRRQPGRVPDKWAFVLESRRYGDV